jgi:hypothetical protein
VTPSEARARARAAVAAAELAADGGDHRTAQALRGAAASWERLARPGVAWSQEPARRALTGLKRELAVANGPFKAPQPPKAPPPPAAAHRPDPERIQHQLREIAVQARQEATIEF